MNMFKTVGFTVILIIIGGILMVFLEWEFTPKISFPFGEITPPKYDIRSDHNSQSRNGSEDFETATSSINISEVFTQALSYNSAIDRDDFLRPYVGKQIYGVGVVAEVSRIGQGFLIDIRERNQAILSCSQEDGGEEKKRQLLLLKDKTVNFTGIFTSHRLADVGLGGLSVDECWLERR